MDAIQSAAAAGGADGFAWHFAPRARAPDGRRSTSAVVAPGSADAAHILQADDALQFTGDNGAARVGQGDSALSFTQGKAVLHLLTNSAESFKRILTTTEDLATAEAFSGFHVDTYA